jgi:hypothetical protein
MKLNTNRTCIINQFAGLGDILFCEPIAAMLSEWGYKILWPVLPHYCSLNKHFPSITFVNKNLLDINYEDRNFVNPDGCLIIPLRFSLEISSGSLQDTMPSKYSMFKLDWKDYWSKSKWVRDSKSENELFYDILNLRDGEKYNLISDHFLSDFSQKIVIQTGNHLKNINVERISDYTLIDWSKVIENSTTIHTVGSSINYIIDKLNCKAEEYHLYARKPLERDCSMYDFIFTKKYRIHL